MNYSKLNELAAKAMGWVEAAYYYKPVELEWEVHGEPALSRYGRLLKRSKWNPSTCADDALILLGKIGRPYSAGIQSPAFKGGPAFCYFHGGARKDAETVPLAMTLLALAAAGISESEITAAME